MTAFVKCLMTICLYSGNSLRPGAPTIFGRNENDSKWWLRNESYSFTQVFAPQEYLDICSDIKVYNVIHNRRMH